MLYYSIDFFIISFLFLFLGTQCAMSENRIFNNLYAIQVQEFSLFFFFNYYHMIQLGKGGVYSLNNIKRIGVY